MWFITRLILTNSNWKPPHTVAIWTFPFHQNSAKKSDDFVDLTLAQQNLKKSYFWLVNMKKRCWVMKNRCNYHFLLNVYWAQCTLWQAVSGWSQLSSSSQFSEKDYHFLNLKMPLLSTHFISIFTRSCQIHCFLHTVPAIQQSWKFRVSIWQSSGMGLFLNWNISIGSIEFNF